MHLVQQLLASNTDEKWILLDNQSSMSIFCNTNFVRDMHDLQQDEECLQVQMNGGMFNVSKEARVDHFGSVWFNPKSITNTFSHAKMTDKDHITYNNHDYQGNAFIVHTTVKPIRFQWLTNNLYVHKPFGKPDWDCALSRCEYL